MAFFRVLTCYKGDEIVEAAFWFSMMNAEQQMSQFHLHPSMGSSSATTLP